MNNRCSGCWHTVWRSAGSCCLDNAGAILGQYVMGEVKVNLSIFTYHKDKGKSDVEQKSQGEI